jgi:hypothetical protein
MKRASLDTVGEVVSCLVYLPRWALPLATVRPLVLPHHFSLMTLRARRASCLCPSDIVKASSGSKTSIFLNCWNSVLSFLDAFGGGHLGEQDAEIEGGTTSRFRGGGMRGIVSVGW